MKISLFAKSSTGLPILKYEMQNSGKKVLILGGVHGDESEGVWAAFGLIEKLMQAPNLRLNLTIIPTFNADGVYRKTRGNGNGVDLNRNLPTKDWSPVVATPRYHPGPSANSEVENHALVQYLETEKPEFIISLHSWKPLINVNGDCDAVAEVLHKLTQYPIEGYIGYPTPGSLGTYSGQERKIPTITYEIERGSSEQKVLALHVPAILESLKVLES